MTIHTNDPINQDSAREIFNIMSMYATLRNNPEAKVKDLIKSSKFFLILSIAGMAIVGILIVLKGFDIPNTVMLAIWVMFFLLLLTFNITANKRVKELIANFSGKESDIILDEEGIEIQSDLQNVRIQWKNVANARAFDHIVCVFSKDASGLSIIATIRYKDGIFGFIRDNKIDIPVVDKPA